MRPGSTEGGKIVEPQHMITVTMKVSLDIIFIFPLHRWERVRVRVTMIS